MEVGSQTCLILSSDLPHIKLKMMRATNGGNSNNIDFKEGAKLLDMESTDSDTQEHFVLPPLDLKGNKKKK